MIEVIVCIAVLAVIIVPLTVSFMEMLQQSSAVQDRLGQSLDAQRVAANWTADVASMAPNNKFLLDNNLATPCNNPTPGVLHGSDLQTFLWDQGPAGDGQDALTPKSASWVVEGQDTTAKLVRRYCEGGVFVRETTLADHLGALPGANALLTIHGPSATPDTFCFKNSCTIIFDGSFKYQFTADRGVASTDTSDSQVLPAPTITSVAAKNQRLSVFWTPPAIPVGSGPITGYLVEAWTSSDGAGGSAADTQVDASTTTGTGDLTGLTNGTPYWVVVYTQSASGQGLHSEPFGPIPPGPTVPDIPRTVAAAPGPITDPLTELVSWQAPADDGGNAIDQYEVQGLRSDGAVVPAVQVSGSTLSTSIG
ncbi:MAG TPA: fibronectin type III domain-containing protein, partial [Acidimicrobiales bacterium]